MFTLIHLLVLIAIWVPPALLASLLTNNPGVVIVSGTAAVLLLAWPVFQKLGLNPIMLLFPPGVSVNDKSSKSERSQSEIISTYENCTVKFKGEWRNIGKEERFFRDKRCEITTVDVDGVETTYRAYWPYFVIIGWRKMSADPAREDARPPR